MMTIDQLSNSSSSFNGNDAVIMNEYMTNLIEPKNLKEPSVIYVMTQPFYCCIIYTTHDLDQ